MKRLLITVATVFLTACESGPTPPELLASNVTALTGAEVTTTDEAVLIDGEVCIRLGDGPRGMFVQHYQEYTYGGLDGAVNDELVEESWYMDVRRELVTRESGDSIFHRDVDFGNVALEGTPAMRTEIDTAQVYTLPDRVIVLERYILNRVLIYAHRQNMSGSTVAFAHEPFYEEMVAGSPLSLTATGSADIEPLAATVTLRPGARVTGLWNGGDLDFARSRPVLRPDEPLVVELSRPLEPDRSLLLLSYAPIGGVDRQTYRNASATFQLKAPTDRIVIPASALAQIASHMVEDEGSYVFRILEYLVHEDALEIVYTGDGAEEALDGVQFNIFGFYLELHR